MKQFQFLGMQSLPTSDRSVTKKVNAPQKPKKKKSKVSKKENNDLKKLRKDLRSLKKDVVQIHKTISKGEAGNRRNDSVDNDRSEDGFIHLERWEA